WGKQYISVNQLNGVAFSGLGDGWAVGNAGALYGTTEGGCIWYVGQRSVTAQALTGVVRLDEAHAWAVGGLGVAPRTVAGVDSTVWELRTAGASNTLHAARFVSTTQGWSAGSNGSGIVLVTTDGGVTWNAQTAPAGNTLRGIWFVDALRGWAVGDNGRILHTASGGE